MHNDTEHDAATTNSYCSVLVHFFSSINTLYGQMIGCVQLYDTSFIRHTNKT